MPAAKIKFKEKKNTSSRFVGKKRKTLKIKSQTLNARENFTSEKTFELQIEKEPSKSRMKSEKEKKTAE